MQLLLNSERCKKNADISFCGGKNNFLPLYAVISNFTNVNSGSKVSISRQPSRRGKTCSISMARG